MKELAPRNNQEEIRPKWQAELVPKLYENAETYITRVTNNIQATSFLEYLDKKNDDKPKVHLDWDAIEPLVFEQAKKLFKTIPERMPISEINRELNKFAEIVSFIRNPFQDPQSIHNPVDYFKETMNGRDFHRHESQHHSDDSLERNLFSQSGLTDEHFKALIRERVHHKKLILVGGGDSLKDLIPSDDMAPDSVINIDPFLSHETVAKNKHKNYQSLAMRIEDPEIQELAIEKADEIWATWSAPLYLEKASDIIQFFKNMDHLLATGGMLRIYPISLINFDHGPKVFGKTDNLERRWEAWKGSVVELLKSGNYNISAKSWGALILQKIG